LEKAIDYTREEAKKGLRCHPSWQFLNTNADLLYKVGEHEKARRNLMESIDIYLHCGGGTRNDEMHRYMLKTLAQMQNGGIDFSGSWKLNEDKSQLNNTPGSPGCRAKKWNHHFSKK
jgi:hypothetical protein